VECCKAILYIRSDERGEKEEVQNKEEKQGKKVVGREE